MTYCETKENAWYAPQKSSLSSSKGDRKWDEEERLVSGVTDLFMYTQIYRGDCRRVERVIQFVDLGRPTVTTSGCMREVKLVDLHTDPTLSLRLGSAQVWFNQNVEVARLGELQASTICTQLQGYSYK